MSISLSSLSRFIPEEFEQKFSCGSEVSVCLCPRAAETETQSPQCRGWKSSEVRVPPATQLLVAPGQCLWSCGLHLSICPVFSL